MLCCRRLVYSPRLLQSIYPLKAKVEPVCAMVCVTHKRGKVYVLISEHSPYRFTRTARLSEAKALLCETTSTISHPGHCSLEDSAPPSEDLLACSSFTVSCQLPPGPRRAQAHFKIFPKPDLCPTQTERGGVSPLQLPCRFFAITRQVADNIW